MKDITFQAAKGKGNVVTLNIPTAVTAPTSGRGTGQALGNIEGKTLRKKSFLCAEGRI
jgi:hypothetical protein